MRALSKISDSSPEATASPDVVALLLADKRSDQTKRAYEGDLRAFFGGPPTPAEVAAFVALDPRQIAIRMAEWKAEMIRSGLAEATINRRLAAVRSLLKFAHRMGFSATDGRGLVDGEKAQSYRDTRGVDLAAMRRLIQAPSGPSALRDRAILRLLCENALRRAEVCKLDVSDFDLEGRQLLITGKGRGSQKEPITLSSDTTGSITAYLTEAGHTEGALFRNHRGGRLTPDGLYYLIREYGERIGVPNLAPHKLRHSAITAALDATGGDVRKVQKLSRHRNIQTLMIYDDARRNEQGEVSGLLSELLK